MLELISSTWKTDKSESEVEAVSRVWNWTCWNCYCFKILKMRKTLFIKICYSWQTLLQKLMQNDGPIFKKLPVNFGHKFVNQNPKIFFIIFFRKRYFVSCYIDPKIGQKFYFSPITYLSWTKIQHAELGWMYTTRFL